MGPGGFREANLERLKISSGCAELGTLVIELETLTELGQQILLQHAVRLRFLYDLSDNAGHVRRGKLQGLALPIVHRIELVDEPKHVFRVLRHECEGIQFKAPFPADFLDPSLQNAV